jgi:hypothetical protein
MKSTPLTWTLLLIAGFAGCDTRDTRSREWQVMAPERATAVEQSVRAFVATVAHDVTQEGPIAWNKHFQDTPAFFMAVNGQMAFPSGAAAKQGMPHVAQLIKRIDLKWGDDLRVDPLSPELAMVGASWREVQTDPAGHSIEETGYFTGLAQSRDGRWQFRDAHWSSPVAPPTH